MLIAAERFELYKRLSVSTIVLTLMRRKNFLTAFKWLTEGVSPETMEIAHLLHDLDKKGVKIPDINYGQPLGTLA